MAALPPVPNVLRIRLAGLYDGGPWNAIQHWHYTGSAPNSTAVSAVCQGFETAWDDFIGPTCHTSVSLEAVEGWDLTSPSGANGIAQSGATGDLITGSQLPRSVCAVVSWKVNFRWRGGHPRTYWPSGTTTSTQNGNSWTTTALNQFATGNQSYLNSVNSIVASGLTGKLCCVRYVADKQLLANPLVLDIVGLDVDSRIDTQRRRLGPDVAA
jgi:hypothetical protein